MKNQACRSLTVTGILTLIFLLACKQSFLEKPAIGSTDEKILATRAGADALLLGAYSLLDNGGAPGGGWPSGKWIFGGVASDDAQTDTEAGALQPVRITGQGLK